MESATITNNDSNTDEKQGPLSLSLEDIAGWMYPKESQKFNVSIPALQRGLVWKPKQIELLWDSLMRGIPIGSFVVCKQIERQNKNETSPDKTAYHLLDGQQRANAIQLGFDDFSCKDNMMNPKKSILWLDIAPENLPKESSRNFLFRVTTTAHPWGYTKEDKESYLGAGTVRDWLMTHTWKNTSSSDYNRPSPEEIQPIEANCPIPVSILIKAFKDEKIDQDKLFDLVKECQGKHWTTKVLGKLKLENFDWTQISDCQIPVSILIKVFKDEKIDQGKLIGLVEECQKKHWTSKVLVEPESEKFDWDKISKGIATALKTTVLALYAPDNLLEQTQQESSNVDEKDIASIEHLFQRLNQQGTKLDGEELIYSLIKAYWPDLSSPIDEISKNRMPCSRLISLAFRVIYTEMVINNNKADLPLAKSPPVSMIRSLAKDNTKIDIKKAVIGFINIDDNEVKNSLKSCCSKIDEWLGTNPPKEWGLPPVLRSSIAYNNQDLYLLLLLLARNQKNDSLDENCCKLLTGVITYSAWFGEVKKQHAIAEKLYSELKGGITLEDLKSAVAKAQDLLPPLLLPENLEKIITIPEKEKFFNQEILTWPLNDSIANLDKAEKEKVSKFLEVIRWRKDFILYAQRKFIMERFNDYDPARKDLWEAHNRPWDYDHILPYKFIRNKKSYNDYMYFCHQWHNTNGNLRAWPFEDNRSDQATKADEKLKSKDLMEDSFITEDEKLKSKDLMEDSFITENELDGFSYDENVINDFAKAKNFAQSCKSRIIRMYEEWFSQLSSQIPQKTEDVQK